MLGEVLRHLRIYGVLLRNSFMVQMEYRFNFYAGLVMETGFLLSKLAYAYVIVSADVDFGGLRPSEALVVLGCYTLLTGFYTCFFMANNFELSAKIRNGDLDLVLVKPASGLFLVSCARAEFSLLLPNAIAGVAMIVYGAQLSDVPLSAATVAATLVALGLSLSVAYAIMILPQFLAFWFGTTHAVTQLSHSLWDLNTVPAAAFARGVRLFGTFALPIFMVTNYPAYLLLGKLPAHGYLWLLAAPAVWLGLTVALWKYALRAYSSASGWSQ
ncbi:ABC-2 type transport system permease protein [Lysobacter sp. yr284]|uniref:ABC transporter permease n=1 Tax=Lysobacter TaxID=68 RepID=UPI00089ACD4B|nr:ABC-2 family transporter protein [Lysobacter sp. yr284]SDY57576.1 ABC-2 type transport system permease protein [Lysobacter sp. yr284]